MKYLCFLILFIQSLCNYSQESDIDSLKNRLTSISDNKIEKLETLESLSRHLIRKSKDEESLNYFEQFYNLSIHMDDYKRAGLASRFISDTYIFLNDSLKSYEFANNGIDASKKSEDLSDYLLSINQLGRAYDYFGNNKSSIETFLKGLNKYNTEGKNQNLRVISQIYLNLSNSYYDIDENEKAHKTLLDGIEYSEKVKDPTGVSYGLYFLGWKYMDLGNYEKAEKYLLKSLSYADSVILPTYITRNHHALGINYSRSGNYKKALYHDSLAIIGYREANNQMYLFDALNNMAVAYSKMGNYKKSAVKAEEALVIAKKFNNKLYENAINQTLIKAYIENSKYYEAEKILKNILRDTINSKLLDLETKTSSIGQLAIVYENQNKLKQALKYQKQFKTLSDSLDLEKRESNFADIETKYQTEKKKKENLKLKTENVQQALLTEKANTQKWFFALGFIVFILIAFLIWRRYKSEVKAKKTIEDQKETIETLQKDLHHRVKNNLSIIDAFIDELKDDIHDDKMLAKLSELQNRVLSINEVHAQLYKSTDITSVEVKKYVNSIALNVASVFNRSEIEIQEKISDELRLDPSKSSLMGLIINEFITNSFKYAFEEKGRIEIEILEKNKQVNIKLSDNGKGLPEDFNLDNISSYGFRIMKLLTLQLEGTFNFNSYKGLELNIQFPKN